MPAVFAVALSCVLLSAVPNTIGAGAARLSDLERFVHAAERRLERLPDNPARDLDRMRAIHELEALYRRRVADWPPGRPLPAALREVPWMLEELRVNQFAQGLGTRGPASSKRIRRVIEEHAPRA